MNLVNLAIIGLSVGLAIGFNPTLISIISIYMASMIGRGNKKQYYTLICLLFLTILVSLVVFISALLTNILNNLTPLYRDTMNLLISIFAVILGTVLISQYFWPKKLSNTRVNLKKALNYRTTKKAGIYNTLALAKFSFFATINTVGVTILLLSSYSSIMGPRSIVWALPFAIGLIIPLYFIITLIAFGTKISAVLAWKENNKSTMILCNGLTIIVLSWLQLLIIAIDGKII